MLFKTKSNKKTKKDKGKSPKTKSNKKDKKRDAGDFFKFKIEDTRGGGNFDEKKS